MSNTSYADFYHGMGFGQDPFRDRTAEKENVEELFVQPMNYSQLEDAFDAGQTVIVSGNRGSGKTITLADVISRVEKNKVVSIIENYENVKLQNNKRDFYALILAHLTNSMLIYLAANKRKLRIASNDDKILLSFLIKKYGTTITDSQLQRKLESVQLSWIKRVINKLSKPITRLVNYGSTAITNFGNELLTKHFGAYLPNVDADQIKFIFPEIKFNAEKEFASVEISYDLLVSSAEMIKRITGETPAVFLDKLDEDARLSNDAQLVAQFVKDLICDIKLLSNKNIQLVIAVWKIPFQRLGSEFRASKHNVYVIDWNNDQLEKVLNHRLNYYSDGGIRDYVEILDEDVVEEDIENIFTLSNSNPRDLWAIFNELLKAQYAINKKSKLICHKAISDGLYKFVSEFQFYEYYPRKKYSRTNTNNVYTYIGFLLKLKDTDEFTNDELRRKAMTGGSTTNYITAMMNIGLIKKTDRKRTGGAVIYQINDPKVSYAIRHRIDILHA